MANVYDIIVRPIITERSMAAVAEKKYVFEVAKDANKVEIRKAIEQIFGVKSSKQLLLMPVIKTATPILPHIATKTILV